MASYDFRQLSPHDLEVLARDLLQAEWGVTLESFKSGKDGGVDLRYAKAGDDLVVQCKHYVESGVKGLLNALRNEAEKVRSLAPGRYVVVTSVRLSPKNKADIVDTIGASVLVAADVIGADDLNNLLGRHAAVERAHFKLWLASREVLDRVMNNAVVTQTEFRVREVYEQVRRYVQSDVYPKAMESLDEHGVVIVAGPPGVGKTTLANLLLYQHVERGFRAVVVQRISEALEMFQEGERQVFYFDDFLGRTFLGDRLGGIDGYDRRALIDFLRMVCKTPSARFILTTRAHILTQAKARSEKLREANLDAYRVVLDMPSYSLEKRGEILYSHLYFSDLPEAYVREILRGDFYLDIVRHGKFNPRIVEWLSDFVRVKGVASRDYRAFVKGLLDDPTDIWWHAYEQEISDAARTVLLLLFSRGGVAQLGTLRVGFARLHRERCRRHGIRSRPEDFETALRELSGAFVRVSEAARVDVLDASVLDLMNTVVGEAPDNAVDIVAGASEFEQIARVWTFSKTEKGMSILEVMQDEADKLLANIGRCMLDRSRSADGDYRWRSLERRFPVVVDLANELDQGVSRLVGQLLEAMVGNWETAAPGFGDAMGVLDALAECKELSASEAERMKQPVLKAMLGALRDGCFSEDLVGVASMMKDFESPTQAQAALRMAFGEYEGDNFQDELRDCQTAEQFDELIGRLDELQGMIGVDVLGLIDEASAAQYAFERGRAEREQEMHHEAEARWYEQRVRRGSRATDRGDGRGSGDRSVPGGSIVALREMFGSLAPE